MRIVRREGNDRDAFIPPFQDFEIMGKAGKIVRLVRVMRIMRIFKLVRHFAGLQSLIYTLNQVREGI